MQKRRGKNAGLDRHKKKRKPGARMTRAKPGAKREVIKIPTTLDEKATAISNIITMKSKRLIGRDGKIHRDPSFAISAGPAGFTNLMKIRQSPAVKIVEDYPTLAKRKAAFLSAIGGKEPINRLCLEMNQ